MINIRADEELIKGQWIFDGKAVIGDSACQRIRWLISDVLELVGTDESGWDTLYRDPSDNRHWVLYYPESELHGGGPPSLKVLSQDSGIEFFKNRENS